MIAKLLSSAASPGGARGNLSVLFFHRVFATPDPLAPGEPTSNSFDRLIGWLQRQFNLLPLDDAVRRLREGSLPRAAAAVTFDDGYRDNFEIAAPILLRHGVPATFFVASSFLDGGSMWNDIVITSIRATQRESLSLGDLGFSALTLRGWDERRQAVESLLGAVKYLSYDDRAAAVGRIAEACAVDQPRDLMMTPAQVQGLATMGFGIGAHTDTHPILARLPDADAAREIERGRERLEAVIGQRVGLFAYPNGRWLDDFDERHMAMAEQAGFDAAFTTEPGVGRQASNRFALPRFTPWDRKPWRFQLRMVANMRRNPATCMTMP